MRPLGAAAPRSLAGRRVQLASVALVAVLVGTSTIASAQGPVSTGKAVNGGKDQNWSVTYTNTFGTTTLANAFVVTTPPSPPWLANVPGSYQWISGASNGSVGGGPVTYTFGTTFGLGSYTPSSVTLVFRCAVDNGFVGYSLNGGAQASAGCGSSANSYQFGSPQTLSAGFVSGTNTLTFYSTGDGQTDGLVVSVDRFSGTSTVPEPSSLALLGTGLMGLAPVIRRRVR